MPDTEVVETESSKIAEEVVETEAVQDAAETEREIEIEEEGEDRQEKKPGLPRGVQKKINKLTRRNYDLLEQNNQLMSRLDSIEKRLPGKTEEAKKEPAAKPKQDDFNTHEDYLEALVDWKADQKLELERERQSKESEKARDEAVVAEYRERLKDAREKYDDYDEVLDGNFRVTEAQEKTFKLIVPAIMELENGPDVAYWLAQHPEIREEVLSMSGTRAVAEVGRISYQIAQSEVSEETADEEEAERAPTKKQAVAQPKPITPVKKTAKVSKDLDDLSPEEYQATRLKQMAK